MPTLVTGFTWVSAQTVTPSRLNTTVGGGKITFGGADVLVGRQTAGAGDWEEIACTAFGRSLIGNGGPYLLADGLVAGTARHFGTPKGFSIFDDANDVQTVIGQTSSGVAYGLYFQWNCAPGSIGSGEIGTLGAVSNLVLVANSLSVDLASLAFAMQMLANGRTRFGGGSDDGIAALQVNGDLCVDGTVYGSASGGGVAVPANCQRFARWRAGGAEFRVALYNP